MTSSVDEINDLKTKNSELVLKVQYWKMTAAQRENEKLELMKELNDMRLKLARIRSGGAAQARKLDSALQSSSEEALKHLVHASSAVARTIELAKTYMRDMQELEEAAPRWSNISGTPNKERIHRVPPMNVGGQSIQPVVSLSRTIFNTSNPRSTSRSPNPNRSISALPMHMLQDVYIPLTRIDAIETAVNNADNAEDSNMDDSIVMEETSIESQNITEEFDGESSRRLDALIEYMEPEEEEVTPPRTRIDNPLEGPSWLLDSPTTNKPKTPEHPSSLEPDSTTKPETSATTSTQAEHRNEDPEKENAPVCEFSPTVRRRRRASTPPPSPAPLPRPLAARRPSNSGRVLKVMVAKMRLDGDDAGASPPKRLSRGTPPSNRKAYMQFDAPSPNGATDAGVIVSEAVERGGSCTGEGGGDCDPLADSRSVTSADSRDSDGADPPGGRTRRPRKAVTYKEKPLNRKMRR